MTLAAAILLLGGCSGGANEDGVAVTITTADASAYPIVYSQLSSGSLDLYLATPDGGEPVRLTDGSAEEAMPAWSPDGSQIAFVVTENIDTGPSDIYTLSTDGEGLRLLTPDDECASNPSWSPDGRTILYLAGNCGGDAFAWMMNSDGTQPRQFTHSPTLWPDWSPQGRIVYEAPMMGSSGSALFVTDTAGQNPKPLDTGELPSGNEASWSPDGAWIAYVAPTGDPGNEDASKWNEDIFVINADGTGGRRVVDTPGNDHWPPAWSPDGEQLLYTADGPGNNSTLGNLMLVDLQTLRTRPLLAKACHCLFPDWRP